MSTSKTLEIGADLNLRDRAVAAAADPVLSALVKPDPMLSAYILPAVLACTPREKVEESLRRMLRVIGYGWFKRIGAMRPLLAAFDALAVPSRRALVMSFGTDAVLRLLMQLASAFAESERDAGLERLLAAVRHAELSEIQPFTSVDIEMYREEAASQPLQDVESVREAAGRAGVYLSAVMRDALEHAIARAFKDEDGEMNRRRRLYYKHVKMGMDSHSDGNTGEGSCPNCSGDYDVIESKALGTIRRTQEFTESTTRGKRTKVLKVGYDREEETRKCRECTNVWRFKTETEH